MSENELEPIPLEEVQRLDVKPGDVLVFMTSKVLSDGAVERIRKTVEEKLPNNFVMVLEEGMKVAVVRPVKADE